MESIKKDLLALVAHCDPTKESMRQLRIAGPICRHFAIGKESAYKEVKEKVEKILNHLEQLPNEP